MRQVDARRIARRLVGVEDEARALRKLGGPVLEGADAQFRPLQVDEDRRRAAGFLFERADRRDHLRIARMVPLAHIYAEGVGAVPVLRPDHLRFFTPRPALLLTAPSPFSGVTSLVPFFTSSNRPL